MFDDLTEWLKNNFGLDYDDLRPDEQETYRKMLDVVQTSKVTLEDYKKYISTMRQSVEFALANDSLNKNQDLFLKARLKNYILMESFFDRPDRAKEMLEQYKKTTKLTK